MASKLLRLSKNFTTISQRFKTSHSGDYKACLSQLPPTEVSLVNNNVKIASQETGSETTTLGIWLDSGSRYENEQNNGAANLIERLAYKGSAKRAQADLESEIGNLGGRLYSYTTRERTAFYGTCLTKDAPKLLEILTDVVLNPRLSEEDIERERSNLLRESADVEAHVKDVVFDYLHAAGYQGTPLGQTIIGTQDSIKALSAKDLKYYIDTHYKGSRVVLAAAGGIKHNDLVKLGEQHLGKLDNTFDGEAAALAPCRFTGSEIRLRDDSLPYASFAIAVEGPGYNNPDHLPLLIATSALGAYDRSLGPSGQQEICHNYEAFKVTYSDTSLFGVYAVTDPMQCDDFARSALDAWQRAGNSITDAELNEAKNRLITNYLEQIDGSKGNCEDIGEQLLSFGKRTSLNELVAAIEKESNQHIREVTDKYVNNKCPVVAAVGPVENLIDYVTIRTRMYWARL